MSFFGRYYFSSSRCVSTEGGEAARELLRLRGALADGADVWQPPADLYETACGVTALLELAGVRPEDVQVHVTGEVLTVRGVRRADAGDLRRKYSQMEIHRGPFERVLVLPEGLDAARARATFCHGLLEIEFPRAECAKRPAVSLLLTILERD